MTEKLCRTFSSRTRVLVIRAIIRSTMAQRPAWRWPLQQSDQSGYDLDPVWGCRAWLARRLIEYGFVWRASTEEVEVEVEVE